MENKFTAFYNPLIVENIFRFLNAYDLSLCSRVCSLWYKIAAAEKKRRTDIAWIFTVGLCPDRRLELQHLKSCYSTDYEDVANDTFGQLKNLSPVPVFCTAFMTTCLFEKFQKFFPNFGDKKPIVKRSKVCDSITKAKYLNSVMDEVFKSFLPKSCKMTFTVSAGIIGCKADCIPMEVENGPAIAGFFIPHIPGVIVNQYILSRRDNSLAEFVSQNAPVKCLLLFLTARRSRIAEKLVGSCCTEEDDINMAVGGAIVDHTNSLFGSAIAFSGPNVEAASVILNPEDKAEEITVKLELFRETNLLENKCFAYMFACVGRGYYLYEKHNVESEIFSKMYPKVPVVGVFGEGEIGVNYIPNVVLESKELKAGSFESSKQYLHTYTTIFVLISIKM